MREHNASNIDYALIARYATEAALPAMKQIYEAEEGGWACAPQTSILRYFLRVDAPYALAKVRSALAARKQTGCYKSLLPEIAEAAGLRLEPIAIAALNDPDPETAGSAARALAIAG